MRLTSLRHPGIAYRRARIMPRWVRRVDRAANRRINASPSWHAHDRAYSRVSHAADRGLLWYAIAATLVLLGRRRAALRGIGSMITASVVSDVVVKSFFDGRRPLSNEVPIGRRLRAYPTTPSFPSGHSASAAGFAAGVALESGRAGLIVAPLAVAVAYSRMHVGAHWLSDVVGGVGIGVGIALLGRILVPGRGRGRASD
jgi:undecaprenyl-diphosphatase